MINKLLATLFVFIISSTGYTQNVDWSSATPPDSSSRYVQPSYSPAGYRGTNIMKLTPMIMPFNLSDEQYYYYQPTISSPTSQDTATVYVPRNIAHIFVHVHNESTELWIDGVKSKQTGKLRYFYSPPLTPGKIYTYRLHVHNGKNQYTEEIYVRAGSTVHIIIPR